MMNASHDAILLITMNILCDKCGKPLVESHLSKNPECKDVWPENEKKNREKRKKGESIFEWIGRVGLPKDQK